MKGPDESFWMRVYRKRIVDKPSASGNSAWYEMWKNNRGTVDGTLFDILAAREWDEIGGSWADTKYEPCGRITVECTVSDALEAFDNPARYLVEDVRVLEGPGVEITEVVSFTHTYVARQGRVRGFWPGANLERFTGRNDGYRVVVGTSREAEDEFIKLKGTQNIKILILMSDYVIWRF